MVQMDSFFGTYLKTEDITDEQDIEIKKIISEVLGRGTDTQEKLVMYFNGIDKGLVMNKVNAEMMATISDSRDTDDWVGTKVCLYVDPTVEFAGKKVGGVRIKEVK